MARKSAKAESAVEKASWMPLFSESTLILAGLTAAGYLFAVRVASSYIAYFGAKNFPISVGIQDLVFAGTATTVTVISIWSILRFVPVLFQPVVVAMLLSNIIILFLVGLLVPTFVSFGFTWVTVTMFVLVVAFSMLEVISIRRAKRRGRSLTQYWFDDAARERAAQVNMLEGKLDVRLGRSGYLVVFTLLFGIPIVGDFVGWSYAKSQRAFVSTEIEGTRFLIIRNEGDTYLSVSYSQAPDGVTTLQRQFRLIGPNERTQVEFRQELLLGPLQFASADSSIKWKSFGDWWVENFGAESRIFGHVQEQ